MASYLEQNIVVPLVDSVRLTGGDAPTIGTCLRQQIGFRVNGQISHVLDAATSDVSSAYYEIRGAFLLRKGC